MSDVSSVNDGYVEFSGSKSVSSFRSTVPYITVYNSGNGSSYRLSGSSAFSRYIKFSVYQYVRIYYKPEDNSLLLEFSKTQGESSLCTSFSGRVFSVSVSDAFREFFSLGMKLPEKHSCIQAVVAKYKATLYVSPEDQDKQICVIYLDKNEMCTEQSE